MFLERCGRLMENRGGAENAEVTQRVDLVLTEAETGDVFANSVACLRWY
jgi:hypothetical protein